MYNKVDEKFIAGLQAIVGKEHVFVDPDTLDQYKTDEETDPSKFHTPEAVVAPGTTEEVAAIVKLANEANVPITVRSAGTSLSDGAIAVCGGIILLMGRMDRILEVNTEGLYMVAEAGALVKACQAAAKEHNLVYAGDPSSAETCQIGGNLATNAGGIKAIRYGVTRDQVYGMEVVTPTGEIMNVGACLKKKTTGYALEQLIMGSEGTLGIITKVTLKLQPLAPYRFDVLAMFDSVEKAARLVPAVIKAGLNPTSIEFMDNSFVRSSTTFCEINVPHRDVANFVYVTVETFDEDQLDSGLEKLSELCEEAGALEVLEADDRLWSLRRNCQESLRILADVTITDDFVVPVHKVAETIEHVKAMGDHYPFEVMVLGHAGDGNLHVCMCRKNLTEEEWNENVEKFHKEAYPYVYSLGGRLSGEHGIGAKKLHYMEEYTEPSELEYMRMIKRAVDPKNILNPGKIFNV